MRDSWHGGGGGVVVAGHGSQSHAPAVTGVTGTEVDPPQGGSK